MSLVSEYNAEWPVWFERIREVVARKLGPACLAVEHVGSTAVPGMAARPIIDLDVVVEPDRFENVKRLLAELGYRHEGDLGIPEREAFTLENRELAAALPPHHLYVCPRESAELKRHLAFRGFLRAHPEWASRLSELKRSLEERHGDDREAYMAGKDALVREITALAAQEVTGTGPASPDDGQSML
jgi:GrpB-like predicted nucleotidyltransferase (UPF0157 family)